MSLKDEIRQKFGKTPKKNNTPKKEIIIKTIEIHPEIKRLFERICRNIKKTWGFDNKQGKEKGIPKYRNLWEDWESFEGHYRKMMESK
jgi:hypothetical protein